MTYSYDALDRVVQVGRPDGTSRQIVWDKLDVASVTNRLGRKSNPGQPQGLHYDNAYRLIGTTQGLALGLDTDDFVSDGTVGTPNPGNWRSGYAYDAADNLTQASSESRPEGNWIATPNPLNQIASKGGNSWVYDAAGNLLDDGVRNYEWDAEQRLITLTDKATGRKSEFVYDGQSRLTVTKEYPAGSATANETRYLWCGHKVCQARDGSDNVTARYFDEARSRQAKPCTTPRTTWARSWKPRRPVAKCWAAWATGPMANPRRRRVSCLTSATLACSPCAHGAVFDALPCL